MEHFWTKYTLEQCQKAAEFYEKSPDGQWDELAARAIKELMWIRRKDLEAGRRPR